MVIVATTTMPSLLLRDVLLISNSTDELETPRALATESVKSVFTASKLDSVNPSKVISAIILVVAVVVESVIVVVALELQIENATFTQTILLREMERMADIAGYFRIVIKVK